MIKILAILALILSVSPAIAGDLPDPNLSPGEADPNVTVWQVCTPGYSKSVRDVTQATHDQVCASYGPESCLQGTYEMDHIIPLVIGGTNSAKNLFPQSYRSCPYNAWIKDRLEKFMHASVCRTLRMSGPEAATSILHVYQYEISKNWIDAYNRYIVQTGRVKGDKSAARCEIGGKNKDIVE